MSGCGCGFESMTCLIISSSSPGVVLFIVQFGWLAQPLPREGWESSIAEITNLPVFNKDLPLTFKDYTPPKGIEAMPYDMFTKQPIEGWSHLAWSLSRADVESAPANCHAGACAYFFRSVLYEWPESRSRDILAHTAGAMRASYSKLLIEDLVLPDRGADMRQVSVDMDMYFLPEGIERIAGQWKVLLEHAGLQIVKIWFDGSGMELIIEAELWVNENGTESC